MFKKLVNCISPLVYLLLMCGVLPYGLFKLAEMMDAIWLLLIPCIAMVVLTYHLSESEKLMKALSWVEHPIGPNPDCGAGLITVVALLISTAVLLSVMFYQGFISLIEYLHFG